MELFCARQRRKFSRGIKRKLAPQESTDLPQPEEGFKWLDSGFAAKKVPVISIMVFWGLYWGPPTWGDCHVPVVLTVKP